MTPLNLTLRAVGAAFALALLFVGTACSGNNNGGPNAPANSTYSTGQHVGAGLSAGVGPKGAGPAGSQ